MQVSQILIEVRKAMEGRADRAIGEDSGAPFFHASQIIEGAMGWRSGECHLFGDKTLTITEEEKIRAFVTRRVAGEPLQYILGLEWFWKSSFVVGPGVLIPRRETEHLVEAALEDKQEKLRVAELGVGSGNIALSILLERPSWDYFAFEKNPSSVPYFKKNCERLLSRGASLRVDQDTSLKLIEGDFFSHAARYAPYDLILSNPPYISEKDFLNLSPEVKAEPTLALIGGEEGVEMISALIGASPGLLKINGKLIFEMGYDQEASVKERMKNAGFENIQIIKDYSGHARIVKGEWHGRTHR